MYRKLIVFLLSIVLTLTQTDFAALRAQEKPATSSGSELIALLYQPQTIVKIDVKKILTETAPDLFNNEAASLDKLKQIMKLAEDETGVDPYSLNQIVVGLEMGKSTPENPIIVLQTENVSATALAEKIFQNQADNAKFSVEKNPAYQRVQNLRYVRFGYQSEISQEELAASKSKFNEMLTIVRDIGENLAKVKPTKATEIAVRDLNKSLGEISALINKYQALLSSDTDTNQYQTQLERLDGDFQNVSLSDRQRSQKLAAILREADRVEKDSAPTYKKIKEIRRFLESEASAPVSSTPLAEALELLHNLSDAAPLKRAQNLRAAQKRLVEFRKNLEQKKAVDQTDEPENTTDTSMFYPASIDVSRREEIIAGKKTIIIVTKRIFGNEEMNTTAENALAVYNDKILLMGKPDKIAQALNQTFDTGRNRRMNDLIGKTPGALVSFAVNVQNVDLSPMGELFGEQKNAWQVYGGVTGAAKEISMKISVEKTDLSLIVQPENETAAESNSKTKSPVFAGNPAATDLLKLLAKTISGAEGSFTLKFEKSKIARLVEETPKLLGEILNNNVPTENQKKISR